MDIKKYASYFHDGSIRNMSFQNSNIIITLNSAELNEEENEEKIPLGRFNCIRGKLHLFHVKSVGKEPFLDPSQIVPNARASIHDLEFYENKIILNVSWLLKNQRHFFQTIEFLTNDYFFENLPDITFPEDCYSDDEGKYIGP